MHNSPYLLLKFARDVHEMGTFFEKSSDNSFETHEFINLGVRDVLEVSAIVRANSERHAFKSPDIQVVSDALRAIGTSSFARAAKSSPVSWKI